MKVAFILKEKGYYITDDVHIYIGDRGRIRTQSSHRI